MARAKENSEIEHRIEDEVVVDCYGEFERHAGWMCYLEDRLPFPFRASCLRRLPESPLQPGEAVTVTGLLDAAEPADIRVRLRWQKRELAVPLAQLEGVGISREAAQAIADWHYWCSRGYGF